MYDKSAESATDMIGLINLDAKRPGKRSAGKPHAAFEVAGTGNGAARLPRQSSTLPGRSCLESQSTLL